MYINNEKFLKRIKLKNNYNFELTKFSFFQPSKCFEGNDIKYDK